MRAREFIEQEPGIEEVSYSKLSKFSQCPQKAFLSYILRVPDPSIFFAKGKSAHAGMEYDNLEKCGGRKPPLQELLEASVTTLEEEGKKYSFPVDKDQWIEEYTTQIEVYEKTGIRDSVVPVKGTIEAPFQVDLVVDHLPVKLIGFVDVVSERVPGEREVVDYKRLKRPATKHECQQSIQLGIYQLGAQAKHRRYITFVQGGRQKPTTKEVCASPGQDVPEAVTRFLYDNIMGWRAAVKAGNWPKCDPRSYWCGSKTCGYYGRCYPQSDPKLSGLIQVAKIVPVGTAQKGASL